jgi:hypothetical protein
MLVRGSIPKGMKVLHHCDNPRCVRFSHLFLGTQKDNIDDMFAKGRNRAASGDGSPRRLHPESYCGERNSSARLTQKAVQQIRRLYGRHSMPQLAEQFSVSTQSIWAIVHRKTWSHV